MTTLTPQLGLAPGVAVRWEAESPSRWPFELREGARFHDGTPLTAEAVVPTLQRVAGGFVNSELENVARLQSRPHGPEPDSAVTEGEGVVVVSLSEPNLRLPQLANPRMAVQVDPPDHDLAAARALLLGDAGWIPGPDGVRVKGTRRLTVTLLICDSDLVGAPVVDTIGRRLAEAGIDLEVLDPDVADLTGSPLDRVNAATFDLLLDAHPQYDANPCASCRLSSIRPGGDLTVSGAVGGGPEVNALFDEVHVATARRLAAELMQVVIAEEVVAIALATLTNPWLVSPRVQGLQPAPLAGAQQWAAVWLSP